jgi:hypothetical protein
MSGDDPIAARLKPNPEVEGDDPRSVFYTRGEKTTAPWTGGPPCDGLPVVCCTDSTRCGSYLTSDGPCRRYALRGCPLRRRGGRGTRKTGRHKTREWPKTSGHVAAGIPWVEEAMPV